MIEKMIALKKMKTKSKWKKTKSTFRSKFQQNYTDSEKILKLPYNIKTTISIHERSRTHPEKPLSFCVQILI